MSPVVIIGGGISGLTAAWRLRKLGVPSTIIEKRPYLGGVIRTEQVNGCVVEAGPDSFLSVKPWALDLIREAGIESEVIGSNDHLRKTFIRRDGRMAPLPDGLQMLAPTRITPILTTPLLGWGAKLRMGLEWFRRPPPTPLPDRSVADFVRDHYGAEALEYLAEPLLAGVYGGDPEGMSVQAVLPRFVDLESKYGSLTKGALAERRRMGGSSQPLFRTLKRGMSTLTDTLAAGVEWIRGEAEAVEKSYRVRVSGEWIETQAVILACEAHQASRLMAGVDRQVAQLAGAIGYTSSATVALAFDRKAAGSLVGFGFLIPKRERRQMVACTYVGNKFSHRVPEDLALLRCFFTGAALELSDESMVASALDELRELIGLSAQPVFSRVSRWPSSMAQYGVGHQIRMRELEGRLKLLPGLYLIGNGYTGIGIPDCIRRAREVAERVARPGDVGQN